MKVRLYIRWSQKPTQKGARKEYGQLAVGILLRPLLDIVEGGHFGVLVERGLFLMLGLRGCRLAKEKKQRIHNYTGGDIAGCQCYKLSRAQEGKGSKHAQGVK